MPFFLLLILSIQTMCKHLIFSVLTLFISLSCQKDTNVSCARLPLDSLSIDDAKTWVNEQPSFIVDKGDSGRSSWIRNIEFYYCEPNYGYLYMSTSSKEYIYEGIPYTLWTEFKKADSMGRFYNSNIKGKYKRLP